jgi:polyisoprenyl-phosphate glycosyltransferase
MKKLTILCPVYNEEHCIPLFIERVKNVERQLSGKYLIDIFFSNNASTDSTLALLKKYSEIYDNIYFFTLSKNFGYQNSLQYALKHIVGDIFVIIDVDGEDPVEMILEFLNKYENGYDIVYGERADRDENYFIKSLRKLFYRILKAFSDDEIILDMAEFSLFTNEVRLSILDENNSFPFIRAAISRVGYNKVAISYKRNKRISGKTNYNFLTMLKFAVAGILSATTYPLRVPFYIFPFWLFYLGYVLYDLSIDEKLNTWNVFLIISIIFILTILIFSALYLARTYKNIMNRSGAYIVKSKSKTRQQD